MNDNKKKIKIPFFGTNYVERAQDCIKDMEKSVKECKGAESIWNSSCIYENVEIALNKSQASNEDVTDLKTKADELRRIFYDSCICTKKPELTIEQIRKISADIRQTD